MLLTLRDIVTSLDADENIHLGRLLVLMRAFDRRDDAAISGITKLAKLDFLLRYPSYFEKAMLARRVSPKKIRVDSHDLRSVEASMVRYRYGPWDHRYRRFLNILAAKRLITIQTDGRAILLSLTEAGRHVSDEITSDPAYEQLASRAKVLREELDIGPTDIMKFIYATFPEISSLSYDEKISQ